ncbi:MAG TPA: hypothetical protein VNP04_25060 [Alphaproteobacteria bacterium]|nr:hypothetical protein [Alphaproteobacteria bacterium]
MDQREGHIRKDIEETRAAMTEKIEMIEERVHETMEGTKSTIDHVMENVQQVQETIEKAKSTVDNIIDTIKYTMDETLERVKHTTDLIEQVNQNPWIMFSSAIMVGYVLGSLKREAALPTQHAREQRSGAFEADTKASHQFS